MSIQNEINNFEFESIDAKSADIIRNGFYDCYKNIDSEDLEDLWLDNTDILAVVLEGMVDQDLEYPETFTDVLYIFDNCKEMVDIESLNILELKKYKELSSHYMTNPFLVSIIDVIYTNIDNNVNLEDLFSELFDLAEIITETF